MSWFKVHSIMRSDLEKIERKGKSVHLEETERKEQGSWMYYDIKRENDFCHYFNSLPLSLFSSSCFIYSHLEWERERGMKKILSMELIRCNNIRRRRKEYKWWSSSQVSRSGNVLFGNETWLVLKKKLTGIIVTLFFLFFFSFIILKDSLFDTLYSLWTSVSFSSCSQQKRQYVIDRMKEPLLYLPSLPFWKGWDGIKEWNEICLSPAISFFLFFSLVL